MRIQTAPKPLKLVHVNTDILADTTLTPSESIAWAVACSNDAFWCIRLNEIAKRSGCSEKSVQRAFTKKRKSGELLALKLRKKNGTFAQMVYIIHHQPLSQREWISHIQDIDFEKWTELCFKSVNLGKSERDELTPPKLTEPSKYDLVYNRDGILEQRSKNSKTHHIKVVEPTHDQLTDYCQLIDQGADLTPGVLSDYQEYEEKHSPVNMRVPAMGQNTRVDECPPNKLINPKPNSEKHSSDDDTPASKITEKELIPIDFKFDPKLQQRLEVENQIPSDFISNSFERCIRHNRKKPPRTTVDFNNWAENWVLADWREHINKPHYLSPIKPMPKNWGLDSDHFNYIIKDLGLSEDELIILIPYYHNKFFDSGVLSYDWQSDFHTWIDDNFDGEVMAILTQKAA